MTVRFLDGPASGITLPLRRAPLFLRVVFGRTGEWDALDALDDEPRAGEQVHVYRRGRRCDWYACADYRHVTERPADEVLRDTTLWRAWCAAQALAACPLEVSRMVGEGCPNHGEE